MTMIKFLTVRLASVEIAVVPTLVLFSVLYEPVIPVTTIIAIAFWPVRWIATRRFTFASWLNLVIIYFLVMIVLSFQNTPLPQKSAIEAFRLTNGIFLFFCLMNWIVSSSRLAVGLAGILSLAVSLALCTPLVVNWSDKFLFLPMLSKILPPSLANVVHPNVMGGTLAVLLSGITAWWIFRWDRLKGSEKVFLGLAVVLIAVMLFLTQSRGAIFATIVAMALLVLMRFKNGWIVVIIGIIMAVVAVQQLGVQRIWYAAVGETGGSASFTVREEIWNRAGQIITDYPLIGIGMGTFEAVVNTAYAIPPQPIKPNSTMIDHAHNLFLQIAVDLGLPGLIAWLGIWFSVLYSGWKVYRTPTSSFRAFGAAVLCSQVAMGVHGLVDCVTWDTRPSVIVWAIWGLAVAAWRVYRLEKRGKVTSNPILSPSCQEKSET